MKKTGIVILALAGLAAVFLYPAADSNRTKSNKAQGQTQNLILHQIPARLTPKINSAELEKQPEANENSAELNSQKLLARLVGKWEQTKSTSKQILTIKENGTATMVIEPQGIWRTVLGKKVTVDIEWHLNAATLTLRAVGGSPENKLDYIKQLWGSEFVREIHSIEDKMFTLRDIEGDISQKWIRTSY
ncbi:hypothetical protein [Gimesia algae]|uniref:Uncharacterized protein n=1 Tax=Gimesia algae TaxID=2527971 RepID=A0A517V8U4_9PLAN|nr:hypothetical protein [Gimesia algae]QDT89420.1 hypothetical protein Pan161_10490 [Gimesia algae]